MSDETARQIEYLIEATQQDIQIKASLLADVVEGEVLVSEMLQDIKLDVADIKLGLFSFFEEEQLRFKIQQNQDKEANFRRLEELRELSRGLTTGNVVGGEGGTRGAAGDGGAGGTGAVAGAVAGGAAGGAAAAAARGLITRIPQLALIAAAVSGVVDYMGSRPEILDKLREIGLEGQDLQTEATTQTLAKVMSDFSDNVIEPLVEPMSIIAAKELGFNDEEIIGLRSDIKELSSVFKRGTVDLIDMFGRILGRESASAAQREDDIVFSELGAQMREAVEEVIQSGLDADEVEAGLTRLDQIESERQEIASLPLTRSSVELRDRQARIQALGDEQRDLEDRLAPELKRQRIEKEMRQVQDVNRLSQAGYDAGELQTDTQLEFQQTPSDKKEEYYESKISPEIKSAIDSGALSRSYYNTIFNEMQEKGTFGLLDSIAIPVVIEDFKKLEELSPDQLKAILVNDDILLNSIIMRGALETSDRKTVEQFYRMKTEGALDPRTVPQLDAGGTIEPGQVAVVGEKGPELVFGPAEVVGREDTASMLAGPLAAQVNQTTVQQPIPVIVTNAETAALSITPSPTISAAVPVNEMSSNMLAMSSAPVIISSTQGGSTVTNMVNNSSTTVLGGGAPARSSDVGHRRLQDRMQGVV
jgi:hypothetical protein